MRTALAARGTFASSNATLDVDEGEFGVAPLNFEINANAMSMASFTACWRLSSALRRLRWTVAAPAMIRAVMATIP